MKNYKNCKWMLVLITSTVMINMFTICSNAFEQISFENLTIDDGLSQSTVEAILQDSKGYIWIGTNDGLNRYNGSDLKYLRDDRDDKLY